MAENLNPEAHKYSKLIGRSKKRPSDGFSSIRATLGNISPPVDSFNIIYLSFVLGGIGFLLPYNSFVMAMDYFKVRYPNEPVIFEMSLIYILIAVLTVLINNLLVDTFSLNSRINFGYAMSFVTLLFVVVCEVWWEAWGTSTSYGVNLLAVAIVSVGCTVQQSSYYGYTSMLPPKYTQAVMVGESASGVFTSFVRVITKLVINELRGSTVYFFTVSASTVLTCFAMYHLIRRSDFIQFYMALCERAKTRIILEPTEDAGLIETNEYPANCVIRIHSTQPVNMATTSGTSSGGGGTSGTSDNNTSVTTTNTQLSFANPAYEPTSSTPSYKVEDIVVRGRHNTSGGGSVGISGLKRWAYVRCEIIFSIHQYMIAIWLTYFCTLVIYPGVASEIISCTLGSWMPILIMVTFNVSDLIGKMMASRMRHWTDKMILRWAFIRLLFTPVVLFCIIPRHPQFSADFTAFLFSIILGVTNGVLGSLPMIQAPLNVEDRYREITGNLMTLMYMLGLTSGALLAYLVEDGIITPRNSNPCNTLKHTLSTHPTNDTTFDIIHSTFFYTTSLPSVVSTSVPPASSLSSSSPSSVSSVTSFLMNLDNVTSNSSVN